MGDVAGALDSATYRHVIGHFASGVTIVTADDDGVPVGVTASAVSSLSLEPPMLLVCLNSRLHTQRVMSRTGAFAVNVLAEDHGPLAERFAAARPCSPARSRPWSAGWRSRSRRERTRSSSPR